MEGEEGVAVSWKVRRVWRSHGKVQKVQRV